MKRKVVGQLKDGYDGCDRRPGRRMASQAASAREWTPDALEVLWTRGFGFEMPRELVVDCVDLFHSSKESQNMSLGWVACPDIRQPGLRQPWVAS